MSHASHKPRRGTTTVEYALLLAVLVIGSIVVWGALAQSMHSMLQQVVNSFARYPGT